MERDRPVLADPVVHQVGVGLAMTIRSGRTETRRHAVESMGVDDRPGRSDNPGSPTFWGLKEYKGRPAWVGGVRAPLPLWSMQAHPGE